MRFPVDDLYELVRGGEVDGIEVVQEGLIDTSRWSTIHEIIFKHDDKFYRTTYHMGATEYQDVDMFDDHGGTVECTEVEPFQVTTTVYKNKRTGSETPQTA